MCPFLTISLSIYHSRVKYRFVVKKCHHITQGPTYLILTTIFGSKKTGGTLWLLMLGEGVLVPSPKFWVQKSRRPIWKSKLAWFSISIATSVPVILTTRGQQSAPSQLPLWGKSELGWWNRIYGHYTYETESPWPFHFQAPSLVEKVEPVQACFTLRSRDQRSMWMQDGWAGDSWHSLRIIRVDEKNTRII